MKISNVTLDYKSSRIDPKIESRNYIIFIHKFLRVDTSFICSPLISPRDRLKKEKAKKNITTVKHLSSIKLFKKNSILRGDH